MASETNYPCVAFDDEMRAIESLYSMIELAKETRRLYMAARMQEPPLLRRFFGEEDALAAKEVEKG